MSGANAGRLRASPPELVESNRSPRGQEERVVLVHEAGADERTNRVLHKGRWIAHLPGDLVQSQRPGGIEQEREESALEFLLLCRVAAFTGRWWVDVELSLAREIPFVLQPAFCKLVAGP